MAAQRKAPDIDLYGLRWNPLMSALSIEMYMIQHGGQWIGKNGFTIGKGLFFHYKRMQQILWPEKLWHRWNDMILKEMVNHRMIGLLGPASSGKTCEAATFALADYYCFPDCTTVICSSTELKMLEMRVWGEIKHYHKMARQRYDWLPGHLIESKQQIVTDDREDEEEGRDFRNGMIGTPCKKGGNYVGLGSLAGIKNKRVRLLADELHLMHKVFIDAISNLNKNPDFKCIGIGNPKETTDPLGVFCEPAASLGGWDGGIDQMGKSKVWNTRFDDGVCVQLMGSDCPNMDVPAESTIPYPFLITRKAIESDIAFYGKDSLQFTMMNEGRMPRGQGLRRVVTRQMCLKFQAMEPPLWKDSNRTKIGFMDAAYGSVGGDRCVFGCLEFGKNSDDKPILALIETMLVPVSAASPDLPEDQIATFVRAACEARRIAPENFFFDSTGRGSLVGAFARLWSANVGLVEFGGKPSDRPVSAEITVPCHQYYSKFVSELWFSVRLCIEAGQFRGMTEEALQEFSMREWTLVSGNKTEVETKEKMKVKSGRSPDIGDAVVAGLEGARRKGFMIQRLNTVRSRQTDDVWRKWLRDRQQKLRSNYELNYSA